MFFHNLKYELITSIRARDLIIWLMIFPLILGTLFKIAFGSIYENDTLFNTIPTAIVEEDGKNEIFRSVIDSVEKSDTPLLKASYMSEDEAMKALEDDEVKGIIYVGTKLKLTVKSNSIESTILKQFTERYTAQESVIRDTLEHDPMRLSEVTEELSQQMTIQEDRPLTEGNTDPFTAYMYNLIAMVAMFGCITGLHIATQNQANLSELGARRNCAPTPKLITLVAGLIGSYLVQGVCVFLTITYQVLVLNVDYGSRLPLVYLGGFLGGVLGVSLGFFVGSFSSWSEGVKISVLMSLTMILCFMSGLMMGNMKSMLEMHAPIVNDLNPSAVICDSMYYLNVDAGYDRYILKLLTMLAFSVVFVIGGFLLTRRKKYASL